MARPGDQLTVRLARILLVIASVLMAIGVGLGAYASHGLASLDAAALNSFETGVQYQLLHGLGLIGLAIYGERHPAYRSLTLAALLLLTGVILFSGGVYSSSLGGPQWLARLAPTGGVSLMAGWLVFAFAVVQQMAGRKR